MVQEVGVQAYHEKFWLVENPDKIPENLVKSLKIWEKWRPKSLQKWRPKLSDFKKWRPKLAEKHMKTCFLEPTPKKVFEIIVGEFL